MRGTGHPIVLTINGKAELVVQDAASYQSLLDRVDELEALEGIGRGLADVRAGRVTPLKEFEKESGNPVACQVALSDRAKADARQLYDWITERAPGRGPEWFEELLDSRIPW